MTRTLCLAAAVALVLTAAAAAVKDPRGDAQSPSLDIVSATVAKKGANYLFTVSLAAPVSARSFPGLEFDAKPGGKPEWYSTRNNNGTAVWDYNGNKKITSAKIVAKGSTATFTIGVAKLAGVKWRAMTFGHGDSNADQAPNKGFLKLP